VSEEVNRKFLLGTLC